MFIRSIDDALPKLAASLHGFLACRIRQWTAEGARSREPSQDDVESPSAGATDLVRALGNREPFVHRRDHHGYALKRDAAAYLMSRVPAR